LFGDCHSLIGKKSATPESALKTVHLKWLFFNFIPLHHIQKSWSLTSEPLEIYFSFYGMNPHYSIKKGYIFFSFFII